MTLIVNRRRVIGIVTTGLWCVWFAVGAVSQFHFHSVEHRMDPVTGQLVHLHHAHCDHRGVAVHGAPGHVDDADEGRRHGVARWRSLPCHSHSPESHVCPFVSAALHSHATGVAPPDTDHDTLAAQIVTAVHAFEDVRDVDPLDRAPKTSPPLSA